MKKILLYCVAMTLTSGLFAQKGLELGVFGAPQNTWIFNQQDFDEGDALNFRATIKSAFGINAGFNFTNSIGIRSGVGLSMQGQNYVNDFTDTKYKIAQTYVKVPVLLKFNSDPSAKSSFLFTTGVDFGFLSGAKFKVDGANTDLDVKDSYNGVDISVVVGLGMQAQLMENLYLNVLFRASYSVMDIEDADLKPAGRESANHMIGGLQIGVNYILFGED